MNDAAAFLLMFVVFPLWVVAGFTDWACHVRTAIAVTSGLKENALHWLMYAEIGVGLAAVAFFEINAAVLALVLGAFLLHEATVYWDLHYSTMRRDVGPFEQMVHSFLEMLPLVSLALLALIAWPQAQALVHANSVAPEWVFRPKDEPWPMPYIVGALAASMLFNALPLLHETITCVAARGARVRARPQERVEPRL